MKRDLNPKENIGRELCFSFRALEYSPGSQPDLRDPGEGFPSLEGFLQFQRICGDEDEGRKELLVSHGTSRVSRRRFQQRGAGFAGNDPGSLLWPHSRRDRGSPSPFQMGLLCRVGFAGSNLPSFHPSILQSHPPLPAPDSTARRDSSQNTGCFKIAVMIPGTSPRAGMRFQSHRDGGENPDKEKSGMEPSDLLGIFNARTFPSGNFGFKGCGIPLSFSRGEFLIAERVFLGVGKKKNPQTEKVPGVLVWF